MESCGTPIRIDTAHNNTLLSTRKVTSKPSKKRPFNSIIFQFHEHEIMWNRVEGFSQVEINGANFCPTSNKIQYIIIDVE
jgi:hypothetical protein